MPVLAKRSERAKMVPASTSIPEENLNMTAVLTADALRLANFVLDPG